MLVDLTRLLAPFVPHLAEAMWQNLVTAVQPEAPDSVHLADFPEARDGVRDEPLEASVALARQVVALGRTARAASGVRTRQPLATARVKLPGGAGSALSADAAVADALTAEVLDELNVKALDVLTDESGMVERTLYPLLPVIGPRHGKAVGAVMAGARSGEWQLLDDGRVEVGGVTLAADEFQLTARARPGHEVAEEGDLLVALDTQLTPELEAEGLAREVAHRLQTMRKTAGYEISDRVEVSIGGDEEAVAQLGAFRDWLAAEVLATTLRLGRGGGIGPEPDQAESLESEGHRLDLAIRRA